jgi:hypothetical protein
MIVTRRRAGLFQLPPRILGLMQFRCGRGGHWPPGGGTNSACSHSGNHGRLLYFLVSGRHQSRYKQIKYIHILYHNMVDMYLDRGPKFPARLQRKQIRTYVREKRDKEESKYRYGRYQGTYLSIYLF